MEEKKGWKVRRKERWKEENKIKKEGKKERQKGSSTFQQYYCTSSTYCLTWSDFNKSV